LDDFSFFLNNKIGGDDITFKYRYRKQILIGTIVFILVVSIIAFFIWKVTQEEQEEPQKNLLVTKKNKKQPEKETKKESLFQVDIKGAINNPGIYSLKEGKRVIDVIESAGGLTANADTSVINLSKKISDEMVIIIYTKEEVESFKEVKEQESIIQEKCHQKEENALTNDACITDTEKSTTKVSINKATLEELMTINGIGETKAKEIITYREQNGPFQAIEDLTKVPGIGENTLAKIKEDITL